MHEIDSKPLGFQTVRPHPQAPTSSRLAALQRASSGGKAARPSAGAGDAAPPVDFGSKLLHLAWHPEANVIAAAASNSLYMFAAPPGSQP